MKILSVVLFSLISLNSYSQDRLFSNIFGNSGLREDENLIIEISDLKMSHCPQCHVQLTKYSYKVKIKDAFLKIDVRETSRGPIYTPYLESYTTEIEGSYIWDFPEPTLPSEGQYIGKVYKVCAPWGNMANGDCREYQIKYTLLSKVIDLLSGRKNSLKSSMSI